MRFLVLSFALLFAQLSIAQIVEKTISEAIEEGAIECTIQGRWDGIQTPYYDPSGQYYGKCMTMIMKNLSKDTLGIVIEAGQMLISEDTATQDMIITKDISLLLAKNATQNVGIYAMCSEINDNVPWKKKKYTLGEMADEELIRIARAINDLWMQNVCGQGAVWAYTDNATEADLLRYGADSVSLQATREILKTAGVSTDFHEVDSIELEMYVNEAIVGTEVKEENSEDEATSTPSSLLAILIAGGLSFIAFLIYFFKFRKLKKIKIKEE